MNKNFTQKKIIGVLMLLTVSACGGGSSGSSTTIVQPPLSYTISVTISNLTSDGLTLKNGSETINVPAKSTSITFANKAASGSSYAVTIDKQPMGFTDTCAISNASGSISNTAVSNITVTCRPSLATVTTLAGIDFSSQTQSGTPVDTPGSIALDSSGNIYFGNNGAPQVRKLTPAGAVSIFAGNGKFGYKDGAAATAEFQTAGAMAVDKSGNIFVIDNYNFVIRKITPTGDVSTYAGTGKQGYVDGPRTTAQFNFPSSLVFDKDDNLFIAESQNGVIRKITPDGVVSTYAGGNVCCYAYGNGNLLTLAAIAIDKTGTIYGADSTSSLIIKISTTGQVTTIAGRESVQDSVDGQGTAATFSYPNGITIDSAGNIYVIDASSRIRKITSSGLVSTIAGGGTSSTGVGRQASLHFMRGITSDAVGNLYVTSQTFLIQKITAN